MHGFGRTGFVRGCLRRRPAADTGRVEFSDLFDGRYGYFGCRYGSDDITIRYRTVKFTVDCAWLDQWVEDWRRQRDLSTQVPVGLVSSVPDATSLLWANVPNRLDDATIDGLLGCFALPKQGTREWKFWSDGAGAPLETFRTMIRLIHGFSRHIRQVSGTRGHCIGLGPFVLRLLEGREVTNPCGHGPCRLTIHFKSTTQDSATLDGAVAARLRRCKAKRESTFDDPCRSGFAEGKPHCNLPWDAWKPARWGEFFGAWVAAGSPGPGAAPVTQLESIRRDTPEIFQDPCTVLGKATSSSFRLNLQATRLGFVAFVADDLMFLARIALDYWRSQGLSPAALGTLDAASKLARYAVAAMLPTCGLMIHELGHIFSVAGHKRSECCFDTAKLHWLCMVEGELGVPFGAFRSDRAPSGDLIDDFSNTRPGPHGAYEYDLPGQPRPSLKIVRGSGCSKAGRAIDYTCDVQQLGVPGMRANFCIDGNAFAEGNVPTCDTEPGGPAPPSPECD